MQIFISPMPAKRVYVDHKYALRQHKAFAVMVIVLLLAVIAVWFIQIRLMVRSVDFSKVQRDVTEAQAVLQGAFEADATSAADGIAQSAVEAADIVGDALTEAKETADAEAANDKVRAAVGAMAAEELQIDSTEEPAAIEDAETVTE